MRHAVLSTIAIAFIAVTGVRAGDSAADLATLAAIGKIAEGRELAARIAEAKPTSYRTWLQLADFYHRIHDPDRTIQMLETAMPLIRFERRRQQAEIMLAEALGERGDYDSAIVLLRMVAQMSQESDIKAETKRLIAALKQKQNEPIAARVVGMWATPAPKSRTTIDGSLKDWDLSAQVIACDDVIHEYDRYRAAIAMMYDDEYLYVALHFRDHTPLSSAIDPKKSTHAWLGDCAQIRIRVGPRVTNYDCWYHKPTGTAAIMEQQNFTPRGSGGEDHLRTGKPGDLGDGFAMAFRVDPEAKGYVQEIRLPWETMADETPTAGDEIHAFLQLFWGTTQHRKQIDVNPRKPTKNTAHLWKRPRQYGVVTLSPKGKLKLLEPRWKAKRQHRLARQKAFRGHTDTIAEVAFRRGGKQLLSLGEDAVIRLWDRNGRPLKQIKTAGRHKTMAVAPRGGWIAIGGADRRIRLLQPENSGTPRPLGERDGTVWDLAFAPDGRELASTGSDGKVRLWQVKTGRQLQVLELGGTGRALAYSPTGDLLAAAGLDRRIRLWRRPRLQAAGTLSGHRFGVRCLAFSPDGKALASGSNDLTVRVWDAAAGKPGAVLRGHCSPVTALCFTPDGKHLISCSLDGSVIMWDRRDQRRLIVREADDVGILTAAVSVEGKALALAGRNRRINLLRLPLRRP